ncbi:hypothetical protein LX36DRAFT_9096 [Colletotrichum falcatum]|nr:hypothetical protein LX36DRAFT_9096 [Colletotrichum falcatum]
MAFAVDTPYVAPPTRMFDEDGIGADSNGANYNAALGAPDVSLLASLTTEDKLSDEPTIAHSSDKPPPPTATGEASTPGADQSGGGSSSSGSSGDGIGGSIGGSSSSGGSGPNPAPGAIAGIVIGSVVGLSLIAFLVWFLLRQRRRADRVSNGAYSSGNSSHEYHADKEAHARITESPRSPYSDDGQQPRQELCQHHYLHQGVSGAAISAAERSPLSPYSEEGHTPIATGSVESMARSGVPSSTPNATTNVSHLIEDGMTEEEIRQLEDEERALDDAIQQAGQGQGRGRKP